MDTRKHRKTGARVAVIIGLAMAVTAVGSCRMELVGLDSVAVDGEQGATADWTQGIPRGFDFATVRRVEFDLEIWVRYDGVPEPFDGEIIVTQFDPAAGDRVLGQGTAVDGRARFALPVAHAVQEIEIRALGVGLFGHALALVPDQDRVQARIHPDASPVSRSVGATAPAQTAESPTPRDLVAITGSAYRFVSTFDAGSGLPTAVMATRPYVAFSRAFRDDINATFPEYYRIPEYQPQLLDANARSNVSIVEDAEVTVAFIHEGAGYRNSLAYFVFDTDAPPSAPPDPSQVVIVLPNASARGSGGDLLTGDTVALINPTDGSTVFRAGTSIGWVLIANGFRSHSSSPIRTDVPLYYSLPSLNPYQGVAAADAAHTVMVLYDKPTKHADPLLIVGFEDLNRATGDNDFNDLLFSIGVTPFTAVDVTGVPAASEAVDADGDGVFDHLDDFPNDPLRSTSRFWPADGDRATYLFEDRWPAKGDFDFNDIVAYVGSEVVGNAAGAAVELVVDLSIQAAGGGLPLGLALRLPVATNTVVAVSGAATTGERFALSPNGSEPAAAGVAADAPYTVIPLVDDVHRTLAPIGTSVQTIVNTDPTGATAPSRSLRVVIEFAVGTVPTAALTATNPQLFAVVGRRAHEIHPAGSLPTAYADTTLFGTAADRSNAGDNLWYTDLDGAPWALVVPETIPWPTERSDFAMAYPQFGTWVASRGSTASLWYAAAARNPAALY